MTEPTDSETPEAATQEATEPVCTRGRRRLRGTATPGTPGT